MMIFQMHKESFYSFSYPQLVSIVNILHLENVKRTIYETTSVLNLVAKHSFLL